jgi:hypothetical protein
MTCANHPAIEAAAYCRVCGKPMCTECKRDVRGTIYCEPCLERELHAAAPPNPLAQHGPIPGLAFGLGFIPGVGAIYNGQYAKAFVHVVIFGMLISIMDSGQAHGFEPLFGMMLAAFFFYMAFEAFHTAKKRALGQPVDEWSGVFNISGDAAPVTSSSSFGPRAGGAAFLIGLGVLILLSNLGFLSFSRILQFWPLILIGLGVSMLMNRMNTPGGPQGGI